MKSILRILMVVAIVVASNNAAARASDFKVQTLDGDEVPLSNYFEPGKWTMVMLWTTYCRTCRKQYPIISEFHDKHKDSDAKVIGVSLDGFDLVDKVRRYVADQPMTFDNAITEVTKFASAYKAITEDAFTGTPTYLMFDPSGAMVAATAGPMKIEMVERFIAENSE